MRILQKISGPRAFLLNHGTVTVTIRLHGGLRRVEGEKKESFKLILPKGSRLSDVLPKLGLSEKGPVLLAIDGVFIERPETKEICDGTRVSVFPLVAGG